MQGVCSTAVFLNPFLDGQKQLIDLRQRAFQLSVWYNLTYSTTQAILLECGRYNLQHVPASQLRKPPEGIQRRGRALVSEIEHRGPVRGEWSNYSKLGRGIHHCHLTYRYVAVWRENGRDKIIGVIYVGS